MPFFGENFMKPLSRHHVNKHASARSFRSNVHHTKMANVAATPMRGGWRL